MNRDDVDKILPLFLSDLKCLETAEYESRKKLLSYVTKKTSEEHYLFLTHGQGGGTNKHIEDAIHTLEANGAKAWILIFQPVRRYFSLSRGSVYSKDVILFKFPSQYVEMVAYLQSLHLKKLHIHHILHLPYCFLQDLPEFARTLGIPYDYTMHDFIALCPRILLINNKSRYCGMPQDAKSCDDCITQNGIMPNIPGGITNWRTICRILLTQASALIAPSRDTAERHKKILGDMKIEVIPHDTPDTTHRTYACSEPYTIAVIGHISQHKGADVLVACAKDAKERAIPLKFAIIGNALYADKLREADVSINGEYEEHQLPELIEKANPALIFLPSIWPETYSYVLSHIWQNGHYPVAFDIGAQAERIRGRNHGLLLPLSMANSPSWINDRLLEEARRQNVS